MAETQFLVKNVVDIGKQNKQIIEHLKRNNELTEAILQQLLRMAGGNYSATFETKIRD